MKMKDYFEEEIRYMNSDDYEFDMYVQDLKMLDEAADVTELVDGGVLFEVFKNGYESNDPWESPYNKKIFKHYYAKH